MFEFKETEGHIVEAIVSGTVSQEDVDSSIAAFDDILSRDERVSVLLDMRALQGVTVSTLAKDLVEGVGLLSKVHLFDRAAIVTDTKWLSIAAEFEGALLPGLEVKAFASDAIDKANEWLRAAHEAPERGRRSPNPAIRVLHTEEPDVLAFEVDGYVDANDFDAVLPAFESKLQNGKGLRLLNRIKGLGGFDPRMAINPALLMLKKKALASTERYAIITSYKWLHTLVGGLDWAFKTEIRTFEPEHEAYAWAWLEASPRETPRDTLPGVPANELVPSLASAS